MCSYSDSFGRRSSVFVFLLALVINPSMAACPKRCECYRAGPSPEDWIKCDNGELTSFPRSISRTREVVLIRNNPIQLIPENPFGTSIYTEIRYVFLDNNRIDTIPDGAFSVPRYLRVVSLMNNRLEDISSGLFNGANGLEKVHLDKNFIVDLKAGVFNEMWRLKVLSLSGNYINNIEDDAFMGLAELVEVMLNDNRLGVISSGAFVGFRDIRKVDLQRNAIHTIGNTAFSSLYHLEELLLKGNRIFEVRSQWFEDLSNLRVLDLSKNRISHIVNRSFMELSSLQKLDISDNFLSVMGSGKMSGLHNLMELKLANNTNIAMRDGSFWELENLRMLDLRNTSSAKSINMFLHEGNITRLEKIKEIMLSGLAEFPVDLLSVAPRLESLTIVDSNISVIPEGAFDNNIYLKEIYMSNVGLKTIEKAALYPLRKLRRFDISENNLRYLSNGLLLPFHRNLVICFHGNPWHCDCSISWITKWLQRRGGRWCTNSRPVCESPPSLAGQRMWELDYNNC